MIPWIIRLFSSSEDIFGLYMMPAGADSGSDGWEEYLNLSPDSEGKVQGNEHSEPEPASRKREYTREDVGPSSVGPPERTPVDQHTLESVKQLLADHAYIADRIQDLFRALRTNVPGGFQAERLTEILEERQGSWMSKLTISASWSLKSLLSPLKLLGLGIPRREVCYNRTL